MSSGIKFWGIKFLSKQSECAASCSEASWWSEWGKKYRNGRIVSCGRGERGFERDDSCVIADYTGRNCRLHCVYRGADTLSLNTHHHPPFMWFLFFLFFFFFFFVLPCNLCNFPNSHGQENRFNRLLNQIILPHSLSRTFRLYPSIFVIPSKKACVSVAAGGDECVSRPTAALSAFLWAANTFAVSLALLSLLHVSCPHPIPTTPNLAGVSSPSPGAISMSGPVGGGDKATRIGLTPAAPSTFAAFTPSSGAVSVTSPTPSSLFLALVWPFRVLKMTNFTYLLNYTAPRLWAMCVMKDEEEEEEGKKRWTAEGASIFV